jgi:hypothetical protein
MRSLWDDRDMRTQLERQPDGCWVLWERGRVVAEGRSRLRLAAARLWWWLAISLPR